MKKLVSILLALSMCAAMYIPAFAAVSDDNTALPPWVEEGETWFPVGDIMLLEDFGDCPKGQAHYAPSGYRYQGYSTGYAGFNFNVLSSTISILSSFSGNSIVSGVGTTVAIILEKLDAQKDYNSVYFKYVYTKAGGAPYIHIIYTVYENGIYHYLTCEKYFQI